MFSFLNMSGAKISAKPIATKINPNVANDQDLKPDSEISNTFTKFIPMDRSSDG